MMTSFVKKYGLYSVWIVSLLATFGSLYFSEVLKFPPCVLCWYQRILMYPLVIIVAVGILRKDQKIYQYVLPLSTLGMLIAFFHNLLYYGIIPDNLAPCALGVSCTTKFIEWFGFITIPFLSLVVFTIITAIMLMYRNIIKQLSNNHETN